MENADFRSAHALPVKTGNYRFSYYNELTDKFLMSNRGNRTSGVQWGIQENSFEIRFEISFFLDGKIW